MAYPMEAVKFANIAFESYDFFSRLVQKNHEWFCHGIMFIVIGDYLHSGSRELCDCIGGKFLGYELQWCVIVVMYLIEAFVEAFILFLLFLKNGVIVHSIGHYCILFDCHDVVIS